MTNNNEENPWLIVDGQDTEIIGNQLGLKYLRDKIDRILDHAGENPAIDLSDTNLDAVILKSKKQHTDEISKQRHRFSNKIIVAIFLIWFLVLPFIALAFMINMAINSNNPQATPRPIHQCFKLRLEP